MGQRRHHYERAFESYLRDRRIPYICVDEAKKSLLPPGAQFQIAQDSGLGDGGPQRSLKSFDFMVYGRDSNLIVEIKGRKIPARRGGAGHGSSGRGRLECWVTHDDIESLGTWERLFGPGFEAVLVFVYWCDEQPPDGLFQEVCASGSRWYALRSITAASYRQHMKPRSARWRTVDLPAEVFARLSSPFAPAATPPSPDLDWAGDAGPAVPLLEPIA